jgi:transaldolase
MRKSVELRARTRSERIYREYSRQIAGTDQASAAAKTDRLEMDEKKFHYLLNRDAMATEKTAEGICKFVADMAKLGKVVANKIQF